MVEVPMDKEVKVITHAHLLPSWVIPYDGRGTLLRSPLWVAHTPSPAKLCVYVRCDVFFSPGGMAEQSV